MAFGHQIIGKAFFKHVFPAGLIAIAHRLGDFTQIAPFSMFKPDHAAPESVLFKGHANPCIGPLIPAGMPGKGNMFPDLPDFDRAPGNRIAALGMFDDLAPKPGAHFN